MGKRTERNPTGEKIGMAKIPGVEEGKKDPGNSGVNKKPFTC